MKRLPLLIFGILVTLGSVALFAATIVGVVEPERHEQAGQQNLPPIGIDLNGITPQFVDDREADSANPVPLPDDLKRVKKAVIEMYAKRDGAIEPITEYDKRERDSSFIFQAVDKRYVLVVIARPTGAGSPVILIDTLSGSESYLNNDPSSVYQIRTKTAFIYILSNKISYYKPGQSSFLTVANSELAPTETYHAGDADIALSPKETHTDTKLNISVFDGSKYIPSPEDPNIGIGFKKLRDVTLDLP
jgi:hypothetical protein